MVDRYDSGNLWANQFWLRKTDTKHTSIRAGSHFDISISINISIRKICVNRGYIA